MTNSKPLLSYEARSLIDESTWPQAEKLLSKTIANEPIGRMPNGRLVTINISPSIVPLPIYSSSSSKLPTPLITHLPNSREDYAPEGKQEETPKGNQKEVVANPIPSTASSSSSSSSSSRIAENADGSAPLSSTTFRVHDRLSSLAQLRALGLRLRELQSHAQQSVHISEHNGWKHGYKFSVGKEAQEFRLCLIKSGIDCSQVKGLGNQWTVLIKPDAHSRMLNSSYTYSFSNVYEARHMIHQLRTGQIEHNSTVGEVNRQFVWKISLTKEGGHRLMDHPPLQLDSVQERITPETQNIINAQLAPGAYNTYEVLSTTFACGLIVWGVGKMTKEFINITFEKVHGNLTEQQAKTAAKGGAIAGGLIAGGVLIWRIAYLKYQDRRRERARYAAEL